jgi:nucleotide-binding universal stress UspA family protein
VCRRLGTGAPAEQVAAAAVTEAAALVVLGSSGDGQPRRNRLGRVPRRLLATAPCAVVAVPPGASEAWLEGVPAGRVICGVGGDRDATCAESAACLAWGLGRRLRLVHVAPSGGRIPRGATGAERDRDGLRLVYRVLAGIAMPIDGNCEVAIERGRPVDALETACSTDRASLLVIGGRRAATARRTRASTIACHLACRSDVPIVVVPS